MGSILESKGKYNCAIILNILVGSTLGLAGRTAKSTKMTARSHTAMAAAVWLSLFDRSTYLEETARNSMALGVFPSERSCKMALAKNNGFSEYYINDNQTIITCDNICQL